MELLKELFENQYKNKFMKKIIVFTMLLIISVASFSQSTTKNKLTQTDYLQKSKKQKTAAWLLLGTGTALFTTGLAIGLNDATEAIGSLLMLEPKSSPNTGEILFWTGLATAAGSIPLFIAASRNKRKSKEIALSLKLETRSMGYKSSIKRSGYPAITVKFRL
jgi:hypothetical protein